MTTALQAIHLLPERRCSADSQHRYECDPIEIDDGTTWLTLGNGLLRATTSPSEGAISCCEVRREGQPPWLLMLVPKWVPVRVNGLASGPIVVAGMNDTIDLRDGEQVLHVNLFRRPFAGPALAEHAGGECPVCLMPISQGDAILQCVVCGKCLHDSAPPDGAAGNDAALECAKTCANCPCCDSPLVREEGYAHATDA